MVTYLKRRKRRKLVLTALKIDMFKAYDKGHLGVFTMASSSCEFPNKDKKLDNNVLPQPHIPFLSMVKQRKDSSQIVVSSKMTRFTILVHFSNVSFLKDDG